MSAQRHPDERLCLAKKLKEAREYVGFSQEEVAKLLEIPRPAISLIEKGERRVDALELKRFAKCYQRPIAYFTEDSAISDELPSEVSHLARAASKLSQQDREELLRFAEFLKAKTKSEGET